ncbi:cation:proton antiporter [Candidatus Woesearchaeota archaeon]|nr:cation:proton antiporter [Candidatus Woesearchaeota archaeon]
MIDSVLLQIGIIIVFATLLGLLSRLVKQPMILGYILSGLILGPEFFGFVQDKSLIGSLSELGIGFLLFMVGLELDLKKLKHLGSVSLWAGLGQIVFTFVFGFFIAKFFGVDSGASFLIALALTLSSTAIVVKLFSDLKRLDTLTGRVSLGILLVQDVVALVLLAFANTNNFSASSVFEVIARVLILAFVVILTGIFFLSKLYSYIAESSELLFLASVSWCLISATGALFLGLSVAMGGFIAGVSLANIPYNVQIISRTRSLRDFFATIFFVSLGLQLSLSALSDNILIIAVLSAFVIIGNPLIILLIMSVLGFPSRVSFSTGLALSQVSEFSIVIMALGVASGVVSQEFFSVIVFIAVLTFATSTYLITYDDKLFGFFEFLLRPFEFLAVVSRHRDDKQHTSLKPYVILCGANRIGNSFVDAWSRTPKHLLVVDYNPAVVEKLLSRGIPTLYGDISDDDVLERLPFRSARVAIITSSDLNSNILFLSHARKVNSRIKVFCTASSADSAIQLYGKGASYVIIPHYVGGEHALSVINSFVNNPESLSVQRKRHLLLLKKRKSFDV